MNFVNFDLNCVSRVRCIGIEHFSPPKKHITRFAKEYIMYFITSGELRMKVNGEEIHLVQGDVFFFNSGDRQEAICSTECTYYYIHFDSDNVCFYQADMLEYLEKYKQKFAEYSMAELHSYERSEHFSLTIPQKSALGNKNTYFSFLERIKRLQPIFLSRSFENRMKISYSFTDLLILLESFNVYSSKYESKISNHLFATVRSVASFIEENYQTDIGRQIIEEKFNFNYDYINRVFKNEMGESIVKYRNRVRIDNAKFLLTSTKNSTDQIAEAVGFNDKFYFTRYFSKMVGVSPMKYRNRVNYDGV